jgi:hypothetical protein
MIWINSKNTRINNNFKTQKNDEQLRIWSISFDLPKPIKWPKVIGVGGGGSNAINHMFKQGIKGGLYCV